MCWRRFSIRLVVVKSVAVVKLGIYDGGGDTGWFVIKIWTDAAN